MFPMDPTTQLIGYYSADNPCTYGHARGVSKNKVDTFFTCRYRTFIFPIDVIWDIECSSFFAMIHDSSLHLHSGESYSL